MTAKIAIILKGYPRLSESFIAEEIHALQNRGLSLHLVSLRHPTDVTVHPVHRRIRAPVLYLPEYLHQEPRRVWAALGRVYARKGLRAALRVWLNDLRRDFTRNRVRRFGQALVLAAELPPGTTHLHAHFLHTPASVARYTSLITGLPWTCSAHAKDIWTIDDWEKREKLASCRWLVTCTRVNAEHLRGLSPAPDTVELVYHGLDLETFCEPPDEPGTRDGSDPGAPVRLLSVGRAVPKKGFDVLLEALAALPDSLRWRWIHVGAGAGLPELKAQAVRLGLDRRIDWRGAQPQEQVLAAYRGADLFVLASRVAADGDRDGLPNVLLEAQSQKLACLSTRVSGIPELVEHGETGWLVEPDQPGALRDALRMLITDPGLRQRLGLAGRARVAAVFRPQPGIDRLVEKFHDTSGNSGRTGTTRDPTTGVGGQVQDGRHGDL